MNKFSFFITAAILSSLGTTAFAAHTVTTTVEESYVKVEVSGNIASGAENEVVNFYIASTDVEEGQDDFAHADQKSTGAEGSYCFKAIMNPELGGGTFRYTIKAEGADAETGEINIVDMGSTLDIVDVIKNAKSASDIKKAFEGYDPCLGMIVYDTIDKSDIYQGLFESKEEITDTKKLFEELKSLTVLSGLKQGAETMIQDGSLLYLDIIGLDDETAYNYNTQLTDKGKANVNKYILAKDYDDMDDYALEIKKLVYTNMLTNNKALNYDEAEEIIQSFGDMIGIDVSKYNKLSQKNKVRMAILNSGAADPQALKEAYEKAVKSYSSSSSGSSGGGSGSGSYVPSSAGTVTTLDQSGSNDVSGFSDMGNYEWAEKAVAGLKSKNVISGRGGDIFAPQDNITREEFVKAIMNAFSLMSETTDINNKFEDVAPDAWYAPYITQAEKIGVIEGIDDSLFGIGKEITRQDMAAIAFRAIRYTNAQIDTDTNTDGFYDQNDIDAYAVNGVKIFKKMGLLSGYPDGTFRPRTFASRAEAAQFIWNLMNLKGVE